MPKEKINKIKETNIALKKEIEIIEKQMQILLENKNNDNEFFEKLFDIQEQIIQSKMVEDPELVAEFHKLFKMMIFLSSKMDTRDKDFRKKIFNILNDFTENKKNLIELSEYYILLFEEIIKILTQEKKSWFNGFIDVLSKIKAFGVTISIIIIFLFMYLIKIIDLNFYNDIKTSILKPVSQRIEKIIKG
jgi:hypothetical protein